MPVSHGQAADDRTLERYLLGLLTDDETERLDELSVADDELALRLSAVEHDLIDKYVNRELAGEDRERFESQYLTSPARRARVVFAETLQRYQPVATRVDPAARVRPFAWSGLVRQWGLAAAVLLILAAAAYLLIDNRRLRTEAAASRTANAVLEERQRQLEHQVNTQKAATSEAAQELARVREALAALEARGAGGRQVKSIFAFALAPTMRDPAKLVTMAMPRRAEMVNLRLQLDADDFSSYRAVLTEASTSRVVWRSGDLRPSTEGRTRSISIAFPARLLQPKIYEVTVTGISAGGASESIAGYAFRVVIQ
jgi:hypothetical protein